MIYHTSPNRINEINDGLFGQAICFASKPYLMGKDIDNIFVYQLDIEELKIIDAGHIFHDENCGLISLIVADITNRLNVEEEMARDLLDQTKDLHELVDYENGGELNIDDDFWLQQQRYDAAVIMGYDGVEQRDEQGAMWMLSVKYIAQQNPVKYSEWLDEGDTQTTVHASKSSMSL